MSNDITTAKMLIDTKYNNTITLMDAIDDPLIYENLEYLYVPRLRTRDPLFINTTETIISKYSNTHTKVKFVYYNYRGINMTNEDFSCVQLPTSKKGFLARISLTGARVPENLSLDYFIDISKIEYDFVTIINTNKNVIEKYGVIRFKDLLISDYPEVAFDNNIIDFINQRKNILDMYF